MKLIKKWLFPVLTCLIVAGAAVLPSLASQARDVQFGQVHTEAMAVESLPVREPPGFQERMELYARWCSREMVPLYLTIENDDELARQTLEDTVERLTSAGLFPEYLFQGKIKTLIMSRVLLWDPDKGISQQNPITFWELSVEVGGRSVRVEIDDETGFPLRFSVYDLDMNTWLAPNDDDAPFELADRYFDLLGIEGELTDAAFKEDIYGIGDWELWYAIPGTDMRCQFYRNGNLLTMYLEVEGGWSGSGQVLVSYSD